MFSDLEDGKYLCRTESREFVAEIKVGKSGFTFKTSEVLMIPYYCIEDFIKRGKYRVLKRIRNGETQYGSKDTLRVWSKTDFTIYPLKAGIPLYCKKIDV